METLIIILIFSTLTGLFMCFQGKKMMMDKGSVGSIEMPMLYLSSAFLGSLGVLIGIFTLDYQRENKQFIRNVILILGLQIIILAYIKSGGIL